MPNWAVGSVELIGEPKDVLAFSKYFLCDDDNDDNKGKYFARSFTNTNRKTFEEEVKAGEVLGIDFAWSCLSCLIDGYPQDNEEKCITLMDACKKHKVNAYITTTEEGLGFEEVIECDDKGELIRNECNDMAIFKCICGNEQNLPSYYDISEATCWECDKVGEGVIKNG